MCCSYGETYHFFDYLTIIRLIIQLVIIGEYSPIITEPEANNCFSINTQVIILKKEKKETFQREIIFNLQWQNDYCQPFCPSR